MTQQQHRGLVEEFRHSVPYINTHRGKTFVIMLDGETINHQNFANIVNDIGLLHSLGIHLVVVYGARPQIDASLAQHHQQGIYHKKSASRTRKHWHWLSKWPECYNLISPPACLWG